MTTVNNNNTSNNNLICNLTIPMAEKFQRYKFYVFHQIGKVPFFPILLGINNRSSNAYKSQRATASKVFKQTSFDVVFCLS